MNKNFQYSLNKVLASEGGYTNDPRDPGGPTNLGITIHDYRAYVNANGTAADVKALTLEVATKIYKDKYWDKVNGDELPSGVDYCVFDYAVNSGVSRANRVYHTCASLNPDAVRLIDSICNERLGFLRSLRTWKYYNRGWSSRVASVRNYSHILATNELAKPIVPIKPVEAPKWNTTPTTNWLQQLLQSLTIYWSLLSSRVSRTS